MGNDCQYTVLRDISSRGKVRKWAEYKKMNEILAAAYEYIDSAKAERARGCATWLQYIRDEKTGRLRLENANFCRLRLCPVCQWRRSLKLYGQMSQIAEYLGAEYKWAMLTLTMRNVPGDLLSDVLDAQRYAFNLLSKNPAWYRAVRGYYRATEITRNPQTGEYHPHIHALLCVKPSYFTSRYYLPQKWFAAEWARCMSAALSKCGVSIEYAGDENRCADVRAVRPKDGQPWSAAVAECCKYAVKSSDILCFGDFDVTIDIVRLLDRVLTGRRLVTMGGVVRDAHHDLHLSDSDGDGADLVDIGTTDGDTIDNPENANELLYMWHSGYSEYVLRGD